MRLSDLAGGSNRRSSALDAVGVLGLVGRQVDWRNTPIVSTEGGVAVYGRDTVMAVTRRNRLHTALDRMMCHMNKTQDDSTRLHAALDRLLDENLGPEDQNRILHEPSEEEGDEDEEPAEDDGEENEDPHAKVKIPYDELSLDALQRSLDKTLGLDDGAGLSRVMVMDSGSDLRLGNPSDNAMDAVQKFPIAFDINTRARAPWFSAMFTWINKHPQGTKVRDLHQPTLKSLLRELRTAA